MRRLIFFFRHRRLPLFWLIAVIGLALPWAWSLLPEDWRRPPQALVDPGGFDPFAGEPCRVIRIYDGDTATLNCSGERIRVRYYCIDAPEMEQGNWGREARDVLRVITPSTVRLVRHDIDRYGRVIGEVFSYNPNDPEDFENTNLALVYSGMAAVYPQYCRDQRYYDAERAARAIRAGIWAVPGLHQTPWEFRRQ